MRIRFSQALVLGMGFLSLSAPASALDWKSAVAELSRSNPELKAGQQSLHAAQQSIRTSESALYPQVSSSLGYSYGASQSSVLAGDKGPDAKGSFTAGLTISQSIFSGGSDTARIDQARASATSSAVSLLSLKARLSNELKTAFASLVYAQRAVTLQEDIIRRRKDNLNLVELRFESGRENKGSVMQSEAYLKQARFEALQARQNLEVSQLQIVRLLGREGKSDLIASDEVPPGVPEAHPDFLTLARESPDSKQAKVQLESAKLGMTLARAGYFPTLSVSGQLGRQGDQFFPNRETWSVGVALNYPLYSGGKDSSALIAAQDTMQAAALTLENSDRSLVAKLQQAHGSWIQATEKLEVDIGFAKAAQVRADIARSKYNNGLISFDEWDKIENELISWQRSVLSSQRERVVTEANWELLQGKGVIP